ncbi:sensor histidine kinase [Tsuneonella sp. HG249]
MGGSDGLSWQRIGQQIGRAMLARHSLAASLAWTAVAVIIPTAIRYGLDRGENGVPFVTFFPAIVLAGLFLGWRYGALTAILSAAVVRMVLMEAAPRLGESPEGLAIVGMFALTCVVLLGIVEALRRVFAQAAGATAREALLNQELRHRLKNLLALVGSLSTLSVRHSDPEKAHQAFTERLIALSRAVDLLGTEGPTAFGLPDLALEALRPFMSDYDIRLSGDTCAVDRDSCVPAVLALHELATNAIKYGALSIPEGWVEVSWGQPAQGSVTALWCERGGPPVKPPGRKGMGSRILSMRSAAASFAVEYPEDGVRCALKLRCPAA